MDWSTATSWWIVTGVLVAAELATGTFYLLMLALGTAAAALGAHLDLGFNGQLAAAALVGGGGTIGWHLKRRAEPSSLPAGENRDVNLDIGQTVHVSVWDTEGGAQVSYRGANWSARYIGSGAPKPGQHRIHAIDGSSLLLDVVPHSH